MIEDRPPIPLLHTLTAVARCAVATILLLGRGAVRLPKDHRNETIGFADGSRGRVYRETIVPGAPDDAPAVLVVSFRLRWVRGIGHAAFRAESLLNTPLFVGFPGFVSKFWLAHDEQGNYRGVYQWNDPVLADRYARSLWWVLALVSERASIHYVVLPGVGRDELLADPLIVGPMAPGSEQAWWRPVAVDRRTAANDRMSIVKSGGGVAPQFVEPASPVGHGSAANTRRAQSPLRAVFR